MASIITIILFFVYLWGLGYTVTSYLRLPQNKFEKNFLRLAFGLGVFPLLAVVLNLFRVPLDWKIFLIISLAYPVFRIFKKYKNKKLDLDFFEVTKSNIALIIVLIIFAVSLYTYATGTFKYPYLEDEDPWDHAVGAKFVALEKTAYDPDVKVKGYDIDPVLSYIDPYPPAYNILMGVLHQTSEDLRWTLKFFNALIISLGVIFFYLFAKIFMQSRWKAVFATFILASVPSYLSHFIWAHSMVITLVFPTLYAFYKIRDDKKWMYPAGIFLAGIWLTQNISQPIKITCMVLIYLIVTSIINKKLDKEGFMALGGGILLSFTWWSVMIYKYGIKGVINYYTGGGDGTAVSRAAVQAASPYASKIIKVFLALFNPGGSASRAYTFSDFFHAQSSNMINSPIGIGIFVTLLTLIGVAYLLWFYREKLVHPDNEWRIVALFWLIFTFWGVNGMTFPISIARGAFRVWLLMAIPIAMIATEGVVFLKAVAGKKKFQWIVLIILIIGIYSTSFSYKFDANTSIWPTSGSYTNQQEPFEYAKWFDSIPVNTKVFMYAPRDKLTIGFGKKSCLWCQDIITFRENILDKSAKELYSFLREHEYEYLVVNPQMDYRYLSGPFGENKTMTELPKRYKEIEESGLFNPVYQAEKSFVVFRVK